MKLAHRQMADWVHAAVQALDRPTWTVHDLVPFLRERVPPENALRKNGSTRVTEYSDAAVRRGLVLMIKQCLERSPRYEVAEVLPATGGFRPTRVWRLRTPSRSNRGFASLDPDKRREIASKGGRAAHEKGSAHRWNSEQAREAGRKGGFASHRKEGGESSDHSRQSQHPHG